MVYKALRNQLVSVLNNTYILPMSNPFTWSSLMHAINIIQHLCHHYESISNTDMEENKYQFHVAYNFKEPLEILIKRLNECVDFATAASDPLTKGHIISIVYVLAANTVQYME